MRWVRQKVVVPWVRHMYIETRVVSGYPVQLLYDAVKDADIRPQMLQNMIH